MKRLLWVLVLLSLAGCSSGRSPARSTVTIERTAPATTVTVTPTAGVPSAATSTSAAASTSAAVSSAAGATATKTVESNGAVARVTVTRPVPARRAQYYTPKNGTVLYAVSATFVGVSGKFDVNPLYFHARDPQGDTFETELGATDNELASSSVTAGQKLRGQAAFAVPKGKRISLLIFDLFGEQLATWQF